MRNTSCFLYLLLIFVFSFSACVEEVAFQQRVQPLLLTLDEAQVSDTGVELRGEILELGTAEVLDHGFLYSRAQEPDLENSEILSLGNVLNKGVFSAIADRALQKDADYTYRSYVRLNNESEWVLGNIRSFKSAGGIPPQISSYAPVSASIGDTIVIEGSRFSNLTNVNSVNFGGVIAPVIEASPVRLVTIVPNGTLRPEIDLNVVVTNQQSTASEKFQLKAISFQEPAEKSYFIGDTVVILGENFPIVPELVSIIVFGGNSRPFASTRNSLSFVIPLDARNTSSLLTILVGSQLVNSENTWNVKAPELSSFSPDRGTVGTEVVIRGKGFHPVLPRNTLKLGEREIAISTISTTEIRCTLPEGIPSGNYPFSLSFFDKKGTSAILFEVIAPEVSEIHPNSGTWRDEVTIRGKDFGNATEEIEVYFGNHLAEIITLSNTEIKVLVPDGIDTLSSAIKVLSTKLDNSEVRASNVLFNLLPVSVESISKSTAKINEEFEILGNNFHPLPNRNVVFQEDQVMQVIAAERNKLVVKVTGALQELTALVGVNNSISEDFSQTSLYVIAPWRKLADLPGIPQYALGGTSLNGKGYVVRGIVNGPLEQRYLYEYDPQIDLWKQKSEYSYPGVFSSGSLIDLKLNVINGKIYGGLASNPGSFTYIDKISVYDPEENKWEGYSTFEGNRTIGSLSFNRFDRLYYLLGKIPDGGEDLRMHILDTKDTTWRRLQDMPGQGLVESTVFQIGFRAYFVTGWNGNNTPSKAVWVYIFNLSRWGKIGDFPGLARFGSSSFSLNDFGYLLGGQQSQNDGYLKDFWRFDPNNNSWTRLDDFPGTARSKATVFTIGNKAYYGFGNTNTSLGSNDFWEYDPSKE